MDEWRSTTSSRSVLTLMLLVANLVLTKSCKKPEKWLNPMQIGTHLRVLSESYPMDTNMTGFSWFSIRIELMKTIYKKNENIISILTFYKDGMYTNEI